MRSAIAVILFTLFNLGAFGVTIKQHLCCHAQQEESTNKHCTAKEDCCDDSENCCHEIVSQVKIAKDYQASQFKISLEKSAFLLPTPNYFGSASNLSLLKNIEYALVAYFPPPENFQVNYCSFLI